MLPTMSTALNTEILSSSAMIQSTAFHTCREFIAILCPVGHLDIITADNKYLIQNISNGN